MALRKEETGKKLDKPSGEPSLLPGERAHSSLSSTSWVTGSEAEAEALFSLVDLRGATSSCSMLASSWRWFALLSMTDWTSDWQVPEKTICGDRESRGDGRQVNMEDKNRQATESCMRSCLLVRGIRLYGGLNTLRWTMKVLFPGHITIPRCQVALSPEALHQQTFI